MAEIGTLSSLRGLKPGSQNHRIVTYLADGREREMRDIHRACGFMRLNSRVSELRSHGWQVECRREGSNWFYRLVSTPAETPESTAAAVPLHGGIAPERAAVVSDAWATRPDNERVAGSGPVPVSVAASDLQLELLEAA